MNPLSGNPEPISSLPPTSPSTQQQPQVENKGRASVDLDALVAKIKETKVGIAGHRTSIGSIPDKAQAGIQKTYQNLKEMVSGAKKTTDEIPTRVQSSEHKGNIFRTVGFVIGFLSSMEVNKTRLHDVGEKVHSYTKEKFDVVSSKVSEQIAARFPKKTENEKEVKDENGPPKLAGERFSPVKEAGREFLKGLLLVGTVSFNIADWTVKTSAAGFKEGYQNALNEKIAPELVQAAKDARTEKLAPGVEAFTKLPEDIKERLLKGEGTRAIYNNSDEVGQNALNDLAVSVKGLNQDECKAVANEIIAQSEGTKKQAENLAAKLKFITFALPRREE